MFVRATSPLLCVAHLTDTLPLSVAVDPGSDKNPLLSWQRRDDASRRVHVPARIAHLSIGHLFASHDCVWPLELVCVGSRVLTRRPVCCGCFSLPSHCEFSSFSINLQHPTIIFPSHLVSPTPLLSFVKVWVMSQFSYQLKTAKGHRDSFH